MNGQDGGAPVTWNTILYVVKGPLVKNNARAIEIYEHLKEESFEQSKGKFMCYYFNYHFNIKGRGIFNINYTSILYGA